MKCKNKIQTNCRTSKEVILVSVIALNNQSAECIYNLFENSDCPSRVYLGIYEISEVNCVEEYKKLALKSSCSGLSYESNVSVYKRFEEDNQTYGAILETIDNFRQKADYVMTTNDGIRLKRGWDTTLLHELRDKPQSAITVHSPKSFSILGGFDENEFPFITAREFINSNIEKVKFWSHTFSFARFQFWNEIPRSKHLNNLNKGIDIIVSLILTEKKWTFLHTNLIFEGFSQLHWSFSSKHSSEFAKKMLSKEGLQMLGIYKSIDSNAILGIVDDKNQDEILSKYGTLADYEYLKRKFTN